MKKKVAVVMGGYSGECEVSLRSGQLILNSLDENKYEIYEIHILSEGWFFIENGKRFLIDKGDFSAQKYGNKITFDVIVNTIHGTPGEDGQLQAYWKLLHIPYTGCDFYQSALTFNKRDTLSVLAKFGIAKAESIYASKKDILDKDEIIKKLGLPLFVKANRSGSSLGVSKVKSTEEFSQALKNAFEVDDEILIESFLDGREISVGVLCLNGKTTVMGHTEIISENDFFDYEAKYEGKSQEITPAPLCDTLREKIDEVTVKIYESLNMSGFSRIDYIIVGDIPYFIEINTNPGLSPQSIFPQQVAHKGLKFSDLLDSEIELAFQRK
ncbi:D-alanine--D-alanine ligase [Capnocytophaga canimorsus]|uniref:D-alanine--D-alanine ligase n=1 Tax=Capnocytophaga canimorsus TaxID=28188 RepID=UPI001AC5B278|nr:D-alanine--D-alanine ligase [Capnocytophaga canimorsus]GIM59255.1 D-alanine--D-alanine ligase [Capnocytophaga canimorsus]